MLFDIDIATRDIFIRPGTTDCRKGAVSLAALAMGWMDRDATDGSLFVFCSADRRTVKVLVWDGNGFLLCQKRLSRGTFAWPVDNTEAMLVQADELRMTLAGMDCWRRFERVGKPA